MYRLILRLELTEPYQSAGRVLDIARKMDFQLVRLRLYAVAGNRHRMDISLWAPTHDGYWRDCLILRLEGTPGIGDVSCKDAVGGWVSRSQTDLLTIKGTD